MTKYDKYEMSKTILKYADMIDQTNKDDIKLLIKELICNIGSIQDDCSDPDKVERHLQILKRMLKALDD